MGEFESYDIKIFIGGLLIIVKKTMDISKYYKLIGRKVIIDGTIRKIRAIQVTTLPKQLRSNYVGLVI